MKMDLGQIEENVEALDTSKGFDFVYDLLTAYGFPKATIARLRKGTGAVAPSERERLLKNKLYYRFLEEWETNEDIHAVIDDASRDDSIAKAKPRFLIVRDKDTVVAIDQKTRETLHTPIEKLHLHASFFLPWAGIEKAQLETSHYADIKAAEKMARLYDEILKVNEFSTDEDRHALNVFFSRLLFCFFAEDTGIFQDGQVTTAVGSLTRDDGTDLDSFLDQLFDVLDTPERDRGELPTYLASFGYVNGSLFSHRTRVPKLSGKARSIILECAELNWSEINPDIFGSMMQAVVHVDQRASLGMHYTPPEIIMKVLRPLFLDTIEDEFAPAEDDPRRLRRLHDRISSIHVFDPACGSGNFLVVAYQELRRIEHRILERMRELEADPKGLGLFEDSKIRLDHFHGIEIDDFAVEVARLSLWLAKHQIDKQFEDLFGSLLHKIPLREGGVIEQANATRLDWLEVVRPGGDMEVVLCGNPPYLGSSMQQGEHKADLADYFGDEEFSPNLDYISLWFLKAADYIEVTNSRAAFVTTNSVCQGDHVALLFPKIFARGNEIAFAHESFKWSNSARGSAGVTCAIIGLQRAGDPKPKRLYAASGMRTVPHIGPYLIPMKDDTIVSRQQKSIAGLPEMLRGSQPTDGGHLILDRDEREMLLAEYPEAVEFVRPYFGADDFVNGRDRWCLWIADDDAQRAGEIPFIRERLKSVRDARLGPKSSSVARSFADQPHRFVQRPHRESPCLIVPGTTSERRAYVPVGFLPAGTVVSNSAYAAYDATPWIFSLIQSRMHMAWLRAVGGQLETRLRYSAVLVYNTFPVPELTSENTRELADEARRVLAIRETYPDQTLADLYDPARMPTPLREAHSTLDGAVDNVYRRSGFASDDERLELLFEMYHTMTSAQELFSA